MKNQIINLYKKLINKDISLKDLLNKLKELYYMTKSLEERIEYLENIIKQYEEDIYGINSEEFDPNDLPF